MSPASSMNTSSTFNTFIQSLPSARSLPGILEGSKNQTSAKTWKEPKFSPKLISDQRLVHYLQTIREVNFKNNHKHTEKTKLLNASRFRFRANHSSTLQCMWLADYVVIYFNS
jgi:hypothetical protein